MIIAFQFLKTFNVESICLHYERSDVAQMRWIILALGG